jgi:hypothetical protein
MSTSLSLRCALTAFVAGALACTDAQAPVAPLEGVPPPSASAAEVPSSELVTVPFGGTEYTFFPFTAHAASSEAFADPINLLILGDADPRALRAALMFLDGNRTGTPFAGFDCRWKDAIGEVQAAYGVPAGWSGGAVQLDCGTYEFRFHVRFFGMGGWTLGGVHLDLLIPGTPEHRILSWDVPRELALLDFSRTGLLAGAGLSGVIGPTPTFRELEAQLYYALPGPIRDLMGGTAPTAPAPFLVPSSGQARIILLNGERNGEKGIARQEFDLQLGQIIPTPFCAAELGPAVRIEGPVHLRQQVVYTPSGNFVSQFHAVGRITVTPINPLTGQPAGDPYRAVVNEHHRGILTDQITLVSFFQLQSVIPSVGRMYVNMQVGPGGVSSYQARVDC